MEQNKPLAEFPKEVVYQFYQECNPADTGYEVANSVSLKAPLEKSVLVSQKNFTQSVWIKKNGLNGSSRRLSFYLWDISIKDLYLARNQSAMRLKL